MSGLALTGLASGMDTASLIDQLISLDQQPVKALQTRKTSLQNQQAAYRTLNTKLQALQAKAFNLTQMATIIARGTTSGDSTKVTATGTADTPTGTYNVDVVNLASSSKVSTGTGAGIGNGSGGMGATLTAADAGTTLAALNAANRFTTQLTSGTFTVNGQNVSIDVNTDTLSSVFAKINAATGGNVNGRIGNSAVDGAGYDNKVILSQSGGGQLVVGSAADSSNFLTAFKLNNAIAGTDPQNAGNSDLVSTGVVGTVNRNAVLNAANFAQPVGAGSAFLVNGVNIQYDATKDTLTDVINRINASSAGVTASYDSVKDQVTLQNRTTGASSITLDDLGGGLLKAMGLANGNAVTGTVTTGANAVYKINGSAFSSVSNTVTDAGGIQGLSLTLNGVSTSSVQVSVNVDTSKATQALQDFATAYNAFADEVDQDTTSSDPKQPALLQGNFIVTGVRDRILESLNTSLRLSDGTSGILGELGLTSGDPGTDPTGAGTKGLRYQLDVTKLAQAITNNPNRVAEITGALGGVGDGIFGQLNTYLQQTSSITGTFNTASTSAQSQMDDIDEQVKTMNARIDAKRTRLQAQFNAMELAMQKSQTDQQAVQGMIAKLGQG